MTQYRPRLQEQALPGAALSHSACAEVGASPGPRANFEHNMHHAKCATVRAVRHATHTPGSEQQKRWSPDVPHAGPSKKCRRSLLTHMQPVPQKKHAVLHLIRRSACLSCATYMVVAGKLYRQQLARRAWGAQARSRSPASARVPQQHLEGNEGRPRKLLTGCIKHSHSAVPSLLDQQRAACDYRN